VPLHALSGVIEEFFGSVAAALRHTPRYADAILYGIGDCAGCARGLPG
jgi:hypothetical protein